jgi:uncharacterized membrane protein YfcA
MSGGLVYLVAVPVVLGLTALNTMSGLGTAFVLVPVFYWLGVPLGEAAPGGLLLNFVSLAFASATYLRGKLVDLRTALPVTLAAVALAPLGARATRAVDQRVLLGLFAAFLLFAGAMMLSSRAQPRPVRRDTGTVGLTALAGGVAGFLGGLLGVGGGNVILPVLSWLGFDAKVAAGTTAFIVLFSSLAGFLGRASLGGLDYTFFGVMAGTAVAGALLGSYLMRFKLTPPQLRRIMGAVLFLAAAKIIQGLLTG